MVLARVLIASHADVFRGSSRVPGLRSSAIIWKQTSAIDCDPEIVI